MDVFDTLTEQAAARLRASALAPFVQPYWDRLSEQRYSPSTARQYLNCLAHFAHWSKRRRRVLQTLSGHVAYFIDQHLPQCTCPAPVQRSRYQMRAAMRQLSILVRDAGVQQDEHPVCPIDEQLQHFDNHLLHAKGLA